MPSGIEINEQVVSLAGAEAVLVRLVDESALHCYSKTLKSNPHIVYRQGASDVKLFLESLELH